MNRLDVQTSRLQPAMTVIAGIIMVPLGLGAIAAAWRAAAGSCHWRSA